MKRRRESKKRNSLTTQNNYFARASRFFVYFFVVTTRLPSENAYLDTTDKNSAPEEFACIWQSKWVGIITIETEKMWVHSSCDVFVVVSCRGILRSLIFTKAWSMQAWIPVVSSSLYFWKSVVSFRVDSILKCSVQYQTERFLTSCISLVHEPDKPWTSQ